MKEAKLSIAGYKGLAPTYSLDRAFAFRDHQDKLWHVPAGFLTDGASFPRWLRYVGSVVMLALLALGCDGWTAFWWSIFLQSLIGAPLHRAYSYAAVAHDYLYWIGAPKGFADCVFFRMILRRARALHRERVKRGGVVNLVAGDVVFAYRVLRALVMYLGVALGGWAAYAGHRRRRRRKNAAA